MSQQTVVCTELYRQGFMSTNSYLADASYGYKLNKTNPEAMEIYKALATPIVAVMRRSEIFSAVVNVVATPWREHMEFTEGIRTEDNVIGSWTVSTAVPIFTMFYHIQLLFTYYNYFPIVGIVCTVIIILLRINSSCRNSR